MEDYANTKAVEIEWVVSDAAEFATYATEYWKEYTYKQNSFIGPELYIYHIRFSSELKIVN